MVSFRRSENSILVKLTRFCLFKRIFKIFFKISKIRNIKLIATELFGVPQASHWSYLLVKSHFWCFLDPQNNWVQKTPKMRFYEQVWPVWCLWYPEKFSCNKFDVSDFWNFEKILKIRLKRHKRVFFTKMLFSLRRIKTSSVNETTCILNSVAAFFSGSANFKMIVEHI